MSGHDFNASALGWAGLATGLAGLVVYVLVVLRQPEVVRMLNGSGLLLTSLALTQAREMISVAQGPAAFALQATVGLLIAAVVAQSAAVLRNRRAWDGTERRRDALWDGANRRRDAAAKTTLGEERA